MEDSLGDRMKDFESVPRIRLVRKIPVLIRLDGKAFHTLTRHMERPFDRRMVNCMNAAATALCEKIQGVKLAYVQSDEISLLLTDYQDIKTEAWFDYEIQKMCSVSASIASVAFNLAYREQFAKETDAVFDSRCWNLIKEDICNYFIWRQQDASRNSISGLAQANFSHNELHKKNSSEMQDMLMLQKGINWNDCPTTQKRGFCVIKKEQIIDMPCPNNRADCLVKHQFRRNKWITDEEIPIFSADRTYIEGFL